MPRFPFVLITLLLLIWPASARAGVVAGTGVSSATSGRVVPALAAGYITEDWALTGVTTGVRTPLYHHSAWTLHGLWMWRAGELGWGPVDAGFGVGAFYARRGYRETVSAPMGTADDFNIGPAFRVSWEFLDPAYLAVEAMFGFRKPGMLVLLSGQDSAHVTLGVKF